MSQSDGRPWEDDGDLPWDTPEDNAWEPADSEAWRGDHLDDWPESLAGPEIAYKKSPISKSGRNLASRGRLSPAASELSPSLTLAEMTS